ncbi:helix-turn-helix domain-containing protein [Paenimyroides baculatum]|uniref:Helix-turn-helix transcriptional regulator n=1 Tax=Paenimyroides baculatum TaxID=2608000 RepID=A0A5M6CF56_9FLAO|nr:AraC family transcriptional regulator [Paenimyroides baculatum]KAA5532075.1 helix-turn-helix transcriptional regulator [Paenimyroides baculatum]
MYQITEELDAAGFSINKVEKLVARNNGKFNFNTLEYFVIYIALSDSCILVDGRQVCVKANHMAYIAQFKDVVYDSGSKEDIVIAFSSSFYERSAKDSFILNSDLFFNSQHDVFTAPTIGNGAEIKKLIVNRLGLYRQKEMGLYIAVAHNCVEILLLDGLLGVQNQLVKPEKINFSYIDVVNRFRVLLQKHFKAEKGVSFYSEKLGVSSQRLSVMTELVLGKGAKKVIVQKVTDEAVKMLQNSVLNISEIAMDLGFADEGNFSAFIKKHYNKTPSEIRDTNQVYL